MKYIFLLFTIFAFSHLQAKDSTVLSTDTLQVKGNCGMCKKTIEAAALKVSGVKTAVWKAETHLLVITYDPTTCNTDLVHQAVAGVGYDTNKVKAKDKTYGKLPACCKYER